MIDIVVVALLITIICQNVYSLQKMLTKQKKNAQKRTTRPGVYHLTASHDEKAVAREDS